MLQAGRAAPAVIAAAPHATDTGEAAIRHRGWARAETDRPQSPDQCHQVHRTWWIGRSVRLADNPWRDRVRRAGRRRRNLRCRASEGFRTLWPRRAPCRRACRRHGAWLAYRQGTGRSPWRPDRFAERTRLGNLRHYLAARGAHRHAEPARHCVLNDQTAAADSAAGIKASDTRIPGTV